MSVGVLSDVFRMLAERTPALRAGCHVPGPLDRLASMQVTRPLPVI